ncbi:hypothetical protein [Paenibacillus apiarius]|uniref:hypothetical protein n=1 Tax=Paenibacillus apiarius TaxID=46240 RepID=UPI00300C858F
MNVLLAWAEEAGATKLNVEVRDNDPHALRFAEKLGYAADRHLFESVLDVASVPEPDMDAIVNRLILKENMKLTTVGQ